MAANSFDEMVDFKNLSEATGAEYANRLQWAYSRVLDAAGRNHVDPVVSNMKYFNVWGHKPDLEPARAGKTYIFMTRPDLNFGDIRNLFTVPYFRLSSSTEMGRILMSYLMHPTLSAQANPVIPIIGSNELRQNIIQDALSTSPFIPLITNLCSESSGGKDLVLDTFETDADFAGNKLQYGAGMDEVESIGELTLNFEDSMYNPALFLNYLWVLYIHNVSRGMATAQKQYVINRIVNYTCSIYVFVTDQDGESLTRWAKWTGLFPRSVPMSQIQHSNDLNVEAFRKFSVTYAYNRYEPMKPHVLSDFNRLCRPYISAALTGKTVDSSKSSVIKGLQAGVGGVPRKAVENPYENHGIGDKMRSWYGGHPYILGNKLVFLRPDDVSGRAVAVADSTDNTPRSSTGSSPSGSSDRVGGGRV